MSDYKETAKALGVRHLFGRWGISFKAGLPDGRNRLRIKFIPLDGWITDPKEIENAIRLDDDWVVTKDE